MKEWLIGLWEDGDKFQIGLSLVIGNGAAAIMQYYTEPPWLMALAWMMVNVVALKTNKKKK